MPTSKKDFGRHIFGSLHTADASGIVLISMWDDDGDQFHMGDLNQLNIQDASVIAVASGDTYMFWDQAGIVLNIETADAGANTLTVTGDLTTRLVVGDTFYVYGSTGNDAEYTITVIAYDAGTNLTTLTVAALADGTDDGDITLLYWGVDTATAGTNAITIVGDVTRYFKVGRSYAIFDSTANDGDYTVTSVLYAAATGLTTIVGGAFASEVDDGYVMLHPTMFAGRTLVRGTYTANSGHSKRYNRYVVMGGVNECLYGLAAVGVVDFEFHAMLQTNIAKTGPHPLGHHVE